MEKSKNIKCEQGENANFLGHWEVPKKAEKKLLIY